MPEPCAGALLRGATTALAAAGVPSPRADAELLLAHALRAERAEVRRLAILDAPVPDDAAAAFDDLLARRVRREPLQHLTGAAPFRHVELAVGPGVFVPRPETEVVAQVAIDEAARLIRSRDRSVSDTPTSDTRASDTTMARDDAFCGARPRAGGAARSHAHGPLAVDLCTGSGAIALAVATEVPGARVVAVELDAAAHAWAARNLTGSGVRLVRGDARTALRDLDGTVDVVVSNPPYVPPGAVPRDPEVAHHDPAVALYGLGADGLEVPRGVTAAAARLLRPGGLYVMEHAETQAAAARAMVEATGAFEAAQTRTDLTGRPRMVVSRRTATSVEH